MWNYYGFLLSEQNSLGFTASSMNMKNSIIFIFLNIQVTLTSYRLVCYETYE